MAPWALAQGCAEYGAGFEGQRSGVFRVQGLVLGSPVILGCLEKGNSRQCHVLCGATGQHGWILPTHLLTWVSIDIIGHGSSQCLCLALGQRSLLFCFCCCYILQEPGSGGRDLSVRVSDTPQPRVVHMPCWAPGHCP